MVQPRNRQRVGIPIKTAMLEFGLQISHEDPQSSVRPAFGPTSQFGC
jgi:hypothetical protein